MPQHAVVFVKVSVMQMTILKCAWHIDWYLTGRAALYSLGGTHPTGGTPRLLCMSLVYMYFFSSNILYVYKTRLTSVKNDGYRCAEARGTDFAGAILFMPPFPRVWRNKEFLSRAAKATVAAAPCVAGVHNRTICEISVCDEICCCMVWVLRVEGARTSDCIHSS